MAILGYLWQFWHKKRVENRCFQACGSGSEGAEAPTVWDKARRTIGRIQVMRTVEHYAYILPVGCNPSVRVYSNKAIKVIRIYQNAKRSSDYFLLP